MVEEPRASATAPASDESSQRQRVTTTCAFCGESVEALVADGVAWFAEHRRTRHPSLPEPERRSQSAKVQPFGRVASSPDLR
jgi:hypothetical protein